jgi:hypothetical protein
MDVLALILACSLHPDDALVRVMVDVQSSGNVYFVGDLATLKTHDSLTSAADALRAADDIAGHGGRPAVGLLGVPLDWAARFGRRPIDLFDGCTNIAIGTAMFSQFEAACAPQPSAIRPSRAPLRSSRRSRRRLPTAANRACVLSHLATELGLQGAPAEILRRIDVRPEASAADPAHESAIFGDGVDDAQVLSAEWSDQRIYLDAPSGVRASTAGTSTAPEPPRSTAAASPTPREPPVSSPPGRGLRPIPILPRPLPPVVGTTGRP